MVENNRAELGRLITEELRESGRGPIQVTRGWSPGNLRSFYGWKDGRVTPLERVRSLLEDSLGWRRGVVSEILDAPITRKFTLSEVRDWSQQGEPGAVTAKELPTEAMLTELSHRFWASQERIRLLQEELEQLRGSNVVPLHTGTQRDRDLYDLAASDEHVPGEDDRD